MLAWFVNKLKSPRLWRFGVVGLSGVFVNLGVLFVLADLVGIADLSFTLGSSSHHVEGDVIASAAAIELSIVWNFILNNAWTFKDKNEQARGGFFQRMVTYNVVSLIGMAIQLGCFIGLNSLFVRLLDLSEPGLWKYPAQLVGIAVAMSWNLISNFYFTWAQEKPAEAADSEHARDQITP